MAAFEDLLGPELKPLERFIRFRIGESFDADDVIQETLIAAYKGFDETRPESAFKPWLIGIAKHKIADHFREKAKRMELPMYSLPESALTVGLHGPTGASAVAETLDALGGRDKQILYLYYFRQLPQTDIAKKLGVPLGTVKSRLSAARERFRKKYPYAPRSKGENVMKELPVYLPEYTIERSGKEPFPVRWEEMMGWFIVPREGEKLSWAMYDMPGRKRAEICSMEVKGRAAVHGVEGVEIEAAEYDPLDVNSAGGKDCVERKFIVQLTDTHCRVLAESHEEDGVKRFYTFLDGDDFIPNWGFGEDNCGNEVCIAPKGKIRLEDGAVTAKEGEYLIDIVGRSTVTIGGKRFDTVCVIDLGAYNEGVLAQQFLDREGRTVLWRRFNCDDWQIDRYKKRWSELLPENERLTVNDKTFVHWYDCITDRIL